MELFIIIIINWPLTNIDQTHYLTFDKKCTLCAQKTQLFLTLAITCNLYFTNKNLSKPKVCFHTFKYKLFILISNIRCLL